MTCEHSLSFIHQMSNWSLKNKVTPTTKGILRNMSKSPCNHQKTTFYHELHPGKNNVYNKIDSPNKTNKNN